jgi:hypothetical protein
LKRRPRKTGRSAIAKPTDVIIRLRSTI